ncbi:calphotin [Galendromus occidentalis]|uniref:Calphotin n=1 Tax=Galendromus occidentalis TaxID=34638 RepID=A0AAJ6W0T4_9ACAR|nr:calphotin [Galendromus occidentalis]
MVRGSVEGTGDEETLSEVAHENKESRSHRLSVASSGSDLETVFDDDATATTISRGGFQQRMFDFFARPLDDYADMLPSTVFLTLACALAAAKAGVVVPKVHEEGASVQYRSEDGLGNYQFGYDEKHTTGGSFRKETGDGLGRKIGSYGLHDADGRVRVVNYVADEHGFRAAVQSNEPGVAPEDPAATTINKAPVAVPYAAPMHLDHVTGINVGLAHSVAAPVLGAYSAPVAQVSAPIIAPVGYHKQPMHFSSVLGPSVSNLIGGMPAHIGSYLAAQAAHPLQKAIAYNAPIAPVQPYAPAHTYAPVAAAPAIPAAPVVYKAPAHFGTVVGPSVDHMLNHYVPQHIAAQKFYRSLHSPAVHYQEAPVVSSTLEVAPAAPVASAVVAPVAAAPVASYAPAAAYAAAPVAPYSAVPVTAYATAAPVTKYAAVAPVAKYAAAPVASYAAAPITSYAAAPVASYASAAPVASYAPSVSYASAPIRSYGVSAAPVSPVIGKSLAYSAAPALVQNQYASAAYAAAPVAAAPVVQKQVAYGPAALGYGTSHHAYSGPAVAKVSPGYAYGPVAAPAYARVSAAYAAAPVTKLASLPTYSTPVYAAPSASRPIYSYGPLSVESSIAKPAVFAAPAFDEPAPLAGPVAAHAVPAGPLVGASLASTGVSSVTANVNGYTHELVKPNAYTRVYHYMYGHSPSFYGYSYSPVPLGYRKK